MEFAVHLDTPDPGGAKVPRPRRVTEREGEREADDAKTYRFFPCGDVGSGEQKGLLAVPPPPFQPNMTTGSGEGKGEPG